VRGVATHDRPATSGEAAAFEARLAAVLDATRRQIAALANPANELRVIKVRSHDVVGHTRKTYERVYIAKTRKGGKPKGRPTPAGVMLAKKKPVFGTRLPR
jgi:hypothetical protein